MYSSCEKRALVHQCVEVNAKVSVMPILDHGEPTVSCVKSDIYPCHSSKEDECEKYEKCSEPCTFFVSQVLCVEIPISFGVEVDVDKGNIKCGKPDFGPCTCKCKKGEKEEVYHFKCHDDSTIEEVDNLYRNVYYSAEDTDY